MNWLAMMCEVKNHSMEECKVNPLMEIYKVGPLWPTKSRLVGEDHSNFTIVLRKVFICIYNILEPELTRS